MNAFARHVLRVWRGNIEDVEQGQMFDNFMLQHGFRDKEFDVTLAERMRVQVGDYDWLNQLVGSYYASLMVEAPLFGLRIHNCRNKVCGSKGSLQGGSSTQAKGK